MPTSVNQTRQTTATQRAAEQLRQLIFSGELNADSNHLESELADRLGISRTPVREATLVLQECGLLEVQPRKGVRICALTLEDITEICIMLTELKCLAVRLAAGRNHLAKDLQVLDRSIDALEEAQKTNQEDGWTHEKKKVRDVLFELSGNQRTASTVKRFNDQLRRVWRIAIRVESIPVHSIDPYRALRNAILAGNAQDADTILRAGCEQDYEFLMNAFKKSGLKRV